MKKLGWEERAEAGDGQFAIAVALLMVAHEIRMLGSADAETPTGAIGALGGDIERGLWNVAEAIRERPKSQ